jgi:glycerol-3-phosphate O-acyltransferase 3/4
MICKRAGLKAVPWDGMLKYYRPSPRECENRRKAFVAGLMQGL